ncbi:hypothetical protein ACMYSQ_009465 [Aspergillus niger]
MGRIPIFVSLPTTALDTRLLEKQEKRAWNHTMYPTTRYQLFYLLNHTSTRFLHHEIKYRSGQRRGFWRKSGQENLKAVKTTNPLQSFPTVDEEEDFISIAFWRLPVTHPIRLLRPRPLLSRMHGTAARSPTLSSGTSFLLLLFLFLLF